MITLARVRALYDYDTAAGQLRYKLRMSPRVKVGDIVGGDKERYRYAGVDGESVPLHHLVWFWHHGEWPPADLAFQDGNPGNTHIENLVPQSKSATANKHKGLRATNSTGVKGVSPARNGKFQAHLYGPGGSRVLGTHFKTIADAAAAIERAKAEGVELRSDPPLSLAFSDANDHARRLWRKLNFVTGSKHNWGSPIDLFAEVGFAPDRHYVLAAKDPAKLLGPGNTQWVIPGFNNHTRAGVRARNDYRKNSDPEHYLGKRLLKQFGITAEEYKAKLAEQNGVCAICEQLPIPDRTGRAYILSVDHDHSNNMIRGLLCKNCNPALGFFKDNPDYLRKAADYIEHWRARHSEPLPDNVIALKGHKPA